MVYCSNCGNAVPSHYKICHVCGNQIIKRPILITLVSLYFMITGAISLITAPFYWSFSSFDALISIIIDASQIGVGIALFSGRKFGRISAIGLIVLIIGIDAYYLVLDRGYLLTVTIIIGCLLLFYLWTPNVIKYYNSTSVQKV